MSEAVALLSRISGLERRVRYVPGWTLGVAAAAVEAAWRLTGKEPPLCRAMAREVSHGHVFDSSKAERELGLEFTPPEVWLAETVEWYREVGVVPGGVRG